jgi:hypothetical protein
MAECVIYSPSTPVRKRDAAEQARTVSAPALQAAAMGVNRVAVAVLGDCPCRDWRDHSRVDR